MLLLCCKYHVQDGYIPGCKRRTQSDRTFNGIVSACVHSVSVCALLKEEVRRCVSNKGDRIALLHAIRALSLSDRTITVNDRSLYSLRIMVLFCLCVFHVPGVLRLKSAGG